MATPHPDFDRIAAICVELAKDVAKPFVGLGFRFAALKYAKSGDMLSGLGAMKAGGRINAAGSFSVIYTSTDPKTAAAETFQNFAAFGFDLKKVRPKVVVGVEVKLAAVLDLSVPAIRRRLRLSLKDLAVDWWSEQEAGKEALTQAVGRAAYAAGFEAVLLPSWRQKRGLNLNIFPKKLQAGSSVKIVAEADLRAYLK